MRFAVLSIAYDIGMLLVFGSWLWFLLRRRESWLRYTAAEAAFWKRLHLPPRFIAASRRFGEGQGVIYFAAVGVALSLIMLIVSVGLCVYIQHHHQPNAALGIKAVESRGPRAESRE
jgi:hypothetical protein